jgi:outer membrane lipoprotein-sorting protein
MKRHIPLALALLLPLLIGSTATHAQTPTVVAAEAPVAQPLSARDRADVARIEAYMNGLRSLKARFLQVAPDGAITQGTAWLERPGRMRFQYDPPTPLLLVAGHGLVVFNDRQLNQTSNIPLSSTPLSLLLSDNLKLSGDVTITNISRQPGQVAVTLVRTASPGDGSITLVFAENPFALRQWSVTDAQRQETRVSLFNVELGGHFDEDLFRFIDPRLMPGFRNDRPGRG